MGDDRIYRQCYGCKGTGIQHVIIGGSGSDPIFGDVTCSQCAGEKVIFLGSLVGFENLIDKCNDIMNKCNDIFDKVEALE